MRRSALDEVCTTKCMICVVLIIITIAIRVFFFGEPGLTWSNWKIRMVKLKTERYYPSRSAFYI